jgi:hypothetical protein
MRVRIAVKRASLFSKCGAADFVERRADEPALGEHLDADVHDRFPRFLRALGFC